MIYQIVRDAETEYLRELNELLLRAIESGDSEVEAFAIQAIRAVTIIRNQLTLITFSRNIDLEH